ncbi:MAG: DNA repair protein RecO [Patescibacteria group bacterium]|jgi:DNA repair protein RecO (recombination protein O)
MNETYNLKAIILKREPFREHDARITLYSRERGKLSLIARGTKKTRSKMAGHLEPITLANIMAVRGKAFDYVGGAASEKCFQGVKGDLEKTGVAGEAIRKFSSLIKEEEKDENIFGLFLDFINILEEEKNKDFKLISGYFMFKFLCLSGYRPELKICVDCGRKIEPGGNFFALRKGGLVCKTHNCRPDLHNHKVSDDSIKMLRWVSESDLSNALKVKTDLKIDGEVNNLICSFTNMINS